MADRLSQYPNIPNFMLQQAQQQQQHLQQQQAQQQQAQQQQDPTTFTDQNHVWQQMQHLQQFRPRSGAGMSAPQGTTPAQVCSTSLSQTLRLVVLSIPLFSVCVACSLTAVCKPTHVHIFNIILDFRFRRLT